MSFVTTTSDSATHQPIQLIRTASSHGSLIEIAHPTPDLQSLQGAYIQNVERLEERAERMSVSSDLGEEIRKLQQEQKLSDSRRASLYSGSASNVVEPSVGVVHGRSRNVSTSSYANSIVDINSAARYGGYSPYSPIGSLRSGSWSQVSHPMSTSNPARSGSRRSSRFGMMSTPEVGEASSAAARKEEHAVIDDTSIQNTPRPHSKSDSSDVSEDTRARRMKRLSTGRLPSDGSFSELYNQLAESNGRPIDNSGIRIASDTSFTDIYDQIAGEIKNTLDTSIVGAQEREMKRQSLAGTPELLPPFIEAPSQASKPVRLSEAPPPLPPQYRTLPEPAQEDFGINFSFTSSIKQPQNQDERLPSGHLQIHVPHDVQLDHDDQPRTASSQDTFHQTEGLFQDFDGTHYAPSTLSRYGSLRDASGGAFPLEDRNHSMLKDLPQPGGMTSLVPPPEDGMVYYPAPVPRMLNLPQKISQAPSAVAMAKRKTQLLNTLPEDVKKSAHWLPQTDALPGTRASRMNLASLPPQLRASVFFDPGTQRQDVEIRDQSAMKTLDDLLDASAIAPVGAFTDHPIVGKIGANVYKKSMDHRGSLDVRQGPAKKERKGSFLGLRRNSVGSENALDAQRSRSITAHRLTKMNTTGMLDDSALARGPNGEIGPESGRSTPGPDHGGVYGDLRDEGDYDDDQEGGVQKKKKERKSSVHQPHCLPNSSSAKRNSRTGTAQHLTPSQMVCTPRSSNSTTS
jgi:hypothetical protein